MHIVGLKFLFLNAIKILYHMWCDVFLLFFIFFCEKQIMRVDKVRLSSFILLNSYVLKKEKEKSGHIHSKRKEKWNINPYACMWTRLSWFFLSNSYILKNKRKKVVIYILSERKEKKRKVKYKPICVYVNKVRCLDSSYQTHTFSKTKEKKWSYIYFQKEKKRKEKKRTEKWIML